MPAGGASAGSVPAPSRRLWLVVVTALLSLAACSSPPATQAPAAVITPPPAPPAWSLSVGSVKYDSTVSLGDTFSVTVPVSNAGSGANPATDIIFTDMGGADIQGCTPTCTIGSFISHVTLPGVPAGGSSTFKVTFATKKLGVMNWTMCVYDDSGGNRVYCGNARTTVGK